MLYPTLTLRRLDDRDEERHAEKFCFPPDYITFYAPLSDGGSRVYSTAIPDEEASGGVEDGEPYIDVCESPDMIAKMINDTIIGQSQMATVGSIRAQLRANEELQKKASGIAIPRLNSG